MQQVSNSLNFVQACESLFLEKLAKVYFLRKLLRSIRNLTDVAGIFFRSTILARFSYFHVVFQFQSLQDICNRYDYHRRGLWLSFVIDR